MTIKEDVALGRGLFPTTDGLKAERDRQLVEAHLRHDADAFAVIVDDHRDALLAQARRMLGPDGAVEDVVQETFERALKYLPRFGRSGEYRLGAWLSQILKSVVQNHWERKARDLRSLQAGAAHATHEADVADQVGDPITAAALNQAVRDLPESQRAAFVMREVVGLAYADVAEVLNISEDNARARVSRSKDHLRRTTSGIRSAVGALIALPGVRALHSRFGGRGAKGPGRNRGYVLGTGDRIATQVAASQPIQAVLSVASSSPRGTFVFGLAATVATLGASTVVLAAGSTSRVLALPPSALAVNDSAHAVTTSSAPTSPSGPTPGASTSTNYAWVDPSSSSTAPAAGLAAATCSSSNGVTPPSGNFDLGAPLGMTNAQAVGQGPAVDLSTVGPSFSFASPATITPYGALGGATDVTLESDVCLSSTGAWFTADLSGLGSTVELQGTLQAVDDAGGEVGYVFRGLLGPAASLTGPLSGAVQFVVDLTVSEPNNTAQLTLVFLGENSEVNNPITTTPGPPVTAPTSPSAPSQTAAPTGDTVTAADGSGAPTTLPIGNQGGSGDASVGTFQGGGVAPFTQGGPAPLPPALP